MRTLTAPLTHAAPLAPDALIAAIEDGPQGAGAVTGTLLLRRAGRETALQRLDGTAPPRLPEKLATGLRLPPHYALSRELVLPLAAARDLRSAIGFEMDRLTPFAMDELLWRMSGIHADRARGRITLTLTIVLRAQVSALQAGLARCGITPSFIETREGRIELGTATRPARWRRSVLPALCGALAASCLATPLIRQQIALNAATQAVNAALPAARAAQELRAQLATAAAGRAAIAAARQQGDALPVLATLTAALPDDSWLSDLTLKDGTVSFDGEAADAAKLIGLLSAVPGLHDPNFTAPVTRSNDGKTDIFAMRATVAQ